MVLVIKYGPNGYCTSGCALALYMVGFSSPNFRGIDTCKDEKVTSTTLSLSQN